MLTALSYSSPLVDHMNECWTQFGCTRVARLTGQQQTSHRCTGAAVNGLRQLYGNPTNLTQGLSNQCFPPVLNVYYGLQTLHNRAMQHADITSLSFHKTSCFSCLLLPIDVK